MINLNHVLYTSALAYPEFEPGILKVGFLGPRGQFKCTPSGYVMGIVNECAYHHGVKNKGLIQVLMKFISDTSTGYTIKHIPYDQLYVSGYKPKISLQRVRSLRFKYIRDLLNYNDLIGLIFDSQKSIQEMFKTIKNIVTDYKYTILEASNTKDFSRRLDVKYIVLAEFFPLKNCIMLYNGKADGFGLTLSIIDPRETIRTGHINVKNYIHLTFSRYRDNLCIIDGTETRSAHSKGDIHYTLDSFGLRAVTLCTKIKPDKNKESTNKKINSKERYIKGKTLYWSGVVDSKILFGNSTYNTTATTTTGDPWI